ncbi:MAG: amidohydrolase, partial [Kiritimatiellaeota bacterium]|nr:amidohydrolase [Kiritimatiellota bacterium]
KFLLNPSMKLLKPDHPPQRCDPKKLGEKVMFGTDFSMSLLAANYASYNAHLDAFARLGLPQQNNLCSRNPARFLFGE